MAASWKLEFRNTDSRTHTVVFANGCSLTLTPRELRVLILWGGPCNNFSSYVGSYAYTEDGKFAGTVVTKPLRRSVTLTARTHTIRAGARLSLHGQVARSDRGSWLNVTLPVLVVVLLRHNSKQPFEPIATVRARFQSQTNGTYKITYGWKLKVQPKVTTTYIATVTTQRLCYYPASRCAHPQGQVWSNAKSRPFTVRIRK